MNYLASSTSFFQVGSEYAASICEQERQIESLQILDQTLQILSMGGNSFEGINFQLYHPEMSPKESSGYYDEHGALNMRTDHMRAFVGDDGRIHVVADSSTMRQQLAALDLDRARTLTEASYFWIRRWAEK